MKNCITVDNDGDYILHPADGRGTYCIERRRCRTQAKLLDWLHHLSDKFWITSGHIQQLIELSCVATLGRVRVPHEDWHDEVQDGVDEPHRFAVPDGDKGLVLFFAKRSGFYCLPKCRTRGQLIDCIYQLSSRSWFGVRHVRDLIEAYDQQAAPSQRVKWGCA